MAVKTLDDSGNFTHPVYQVMLRTPGLSVGTAVVDDLLTWGLTNALWVFPMATSCCGIELMAAAASRVDLDRMGTIIRATPRQADVMVVAGTITTKMAPRVKKLWEQMPEPKWAIAMGSCAISGDFYRNLYSVVPGIDTFLPVDVYIPGCPPNPEGLMHGLLRLAEKVRAQRKGLHVAAEPKADLMRITMPSVPRLQDAARTAAMGEAQMSAASNPTDLEDTAPLQLAAPPETPTPSQAPGALALFTELGVAEPSSDGPPLIPATRHLDCARRLKALGYSSYISCVATHWLPGTGRKGKDAAEPEHYEVTTIVRTVGAGSKLASWTVRLALGEPLLTLCGVYPGAEWQEREQYDLVGVKFAGHPDLRRLMMMENFGPHPLRRDFPADAPFAPWR